MSNRRVLLDTGPLVALLTASDAYHKVCSTAFATFSPPRLTCWPVLTEAAWILRKQYRPLDRIADAHDVGLFHILNLVGGDLATSAGLMRRHEDIGLQLADASLIHLAEREGVSTQGQRQLTC